MNRIEKVLFLFALVGLSNSVQALTAENRYDTIIDRNIFRLNPPPVVAAPTNTDPILDRKVELSGISNVGGHKKAWFVVAPKAGSKDLPLYLNLSEGQRQDFLEVVSITEDEGEVKVNNAGNPMVLSLKANSLKPQAVAPIPSSAPPATPVAHSMTPQPTTASYGNTASTASAYGGNSSYGSRGAVTVSGGTPVQTMSSQSGGNSGLRSIPTRTLRLAPVANQAATPQQPVDPVTQRVLMEVQQEQARQSGQQLPPLPPLPQ